MRLAVSLSVLLLASAAHADLDGSTPTVANVWEDFKTVTDNTSTQDCAVACKALESIARAAQHICDVAPEHCEEAKARLAALSSRVHAACPQCEIRAQGPIVPPPPIVENVAVSESVRSSGGGCADCTTAGGTPDATVVVLAGLLLLKKKKRRV